MNLFLLTVFVVYGGMHVYAFLKARSALGFGWGPGLALGAVMLCMVPALFLIRLLERQGLELGAMALSYVAYTWMAVLFLFFCGALAIDLVNLLLRSAGWLGGSASVLRPIPARFSFAATLGMALVIAAYGYVEALNIRTERLVIETAKLPAGIDRLTIAQISDVHLGLIVRASRLRRILQIVKAEQPDVFVSTGDLVDAEINHLPGLRELLQDIRPRYGRFAVTGNHEYYAGLDKALEFTRGAGFTLLRGAAVDAGPIVVAGVDDRTALQAAGERPASDRQVLSQLDRAKFILFLKHQPQPDPDTVGAFDLMLSGHTHRGQIWPFRYFTELFYPLNAGRYDLGQGSVLHVSRGTGTWGPPIRFLSPPQVTIVELVRKS
jgi:predicted MPP superfamily phosphohydrolase